MPFSSYNSLLLRGTSKSITPRVLCHPEYCCSLHLTDISRPNIPPVGGASRKEQKEIEFKATKEEEDEGIPFVLHSNINNNNAEEEWNGEQKSQTQVLLFILSWHNHLPCSPRKTIFNPQYSFGRLKNRMKRSLFLRVLPLLNLLLFYIPSDMTFGWKVYRCLPHCVFIYVTELCIASTPSLRCLRTVVAVIIILKRNRRLKSRPANSLNDDDDWLSATQNNNIEMPT